MRRSGGPGVDTNLFGGKLCSEFVWGLELLQTQLKHLPFSCFALEEKGKSSLQCISELNRQLSGKPSIFKLEDDPCSLLLSLDDVQVLSSGSSKYRDFIRYLPLHLSKYILSMLGGCWGLAETSHLGPALGVSGSIFFLLLPGMLDKNSLSRCAFVSQHWAALTQQVKVDLSMHSFIQNQISLLQVLWV